MSTKMMRISLNTASNLEELVKMCGMNKLVLLEKAVDAFLRQQFLIKANEEFAIIKKNPELWDVEIQERKDWDVTLADGLEDE